MTIVEWPRTLIGVLLVACWIVTVARAQDTATSPAPDGSKPRELTESAPKRGQKRAVVERREADDARESAGVKAYMESRNHSEKGHVFLRRGRYALSIPEFEAAHAEGLKMAFPESLETMKVNTAPTDGGGLRGTTEKLLGVALAAVADYARAEKYLHAALTTDEKYFSGEINWCEGYEHFGLAFVHAARGRYDDAEREYSRFIQILKSDKSIKAGKLHITAHGYLGLASLALARGRLGDAERQMKIPLLVLKEKGIGEKHPVLAAHARIVLGQLRDREGRPDEAEREYRHALTICRTLGPDHPMAAFGLDGLGELEVEVGKLDDAEKHFREALVLREKMLGKDHRELGYSLDGLGRVAAARGDWAAAEPLLGRALAILEKGLGIDHPDVAVVALHRSRALSRLGRDAEATALDRRIPPHPGLSSQGRFLAVPDGLFCDYCMHFL
ncbi:MAG TPA: tetratricopeptide repeat protein [Isosphaeraceae bacterium]|jgi:tetratricopeptide (TPR) repeat protein|nr:tetratricopeptide repeat protein [Isosphaeraceae bacterium]